jgi:hypothetical protein
MYSQPTVIALRDSIAVVVAAREPARDAEQTRELREKVRAAVADLKAAGWSPERVIIAVKQIARDAGLNPSRNLMSVSARTPTGRDAVILDLVGWSIERYYESP